MVADAAAAAVAYTVAFAVFAFGYKLRYILNMLYMIQQIPQLPTQVGLYPYLHCIQIKMFKAFKA
jgi:hypothetical protein